MSYNPSLDRIDVAMRAVVLLSMNKIWGSPKYRRVIGMSDEQRKLILTAVQDMDNWREEDNLVKLIRLTDDEGPGFVLGFALELMRLYTYNSREYRRWHYARSGGGHVYNLPQTV